MKLSGHLMFYYKKKITFILVILVCLNTFNPLGYMVCANAQEKKSKNPTTKNKSYHPDLLRIEHAEPSIDLKEALQQHDFRFIAIMGYAVYVPGVDDYYENYERYGYKIIEGTSDVIEDSEHGRLIGIAIHYAEIYNKLLIKHIQSIKSGKTGK